MLASNLFILLLSSCSLFFNLASSGPLTSNQMTNIASNRQISPAITNPTQTNPFPHSKFSLPQQYTPIQTIHQNNNLNDPYTLATNSLLLDLRQQLINKALKFDGHFRNLLSSSKINLHNMFVDTYGMMYEHNTEIFTSMYESLEQYYATGQIKLTKSMENFFERLYQKIFQVYNLNRAFTPSYLECATEQLAHLKPFKDAPEKLIGEIRHAFVAARTFNQALNSGIDVIKSIISLGQPAQCTNMISDKLHRQDSGNSLSLPCLGFCEQVITRCIGRSNLEQLSDGWRTYVVSLGELAKKLSVQYNIETIIEPLDVQISEAIMNFQDNAQNISQQVFQACGRAVVPSGGVSPSGGLASMGHQATHLGPIIKPTTSTSVVQNRLGKRAAMAPLEPAPIAVSPQRNRQVLNTIHQLTSGSVSDSPSYANSPRSQARSHKNTGPPGRSSFSSDEGEQLEAGLGSISPSSSLLRMGANPPLSSTRRRPIVIDEIKDYVLSTKQFWSNLPNSVCTNNSLTASHTIFNGALNPVQLHQSSSIPRRPLQCYQEQLGLSDMNSDLRYRTEIQQQVKRLNQVQSRINDALHGVEIDWSNGVQTLYANQQPSPIGNPAASIVATNLNQPQRIPTPVSGPTGYSPIPPNLSVGSTISQYQSSSSTVGEDEEEPDDQFDNGSGEPSNNDPIIPDDNTTPDDNEYIDHDNDDPNIEPITNNDDDYVTPISSVSDSGSSTTQQPNNENNEQNLPSENAVDSLQSKQQEIPVNLDISNDLITPPDAQRSSARGQHHVMNQSIVILNVAVLLLLSLSSLSFSPIPIARQFPS